MISSFKKFVMDIMSTTAEQTSPGSTTRGQTNMTDLKNEYINLSVNYGLDPKGTLKLALTSLP